MKKPFEPVSLPLQELDYKRIIGLVARANADLARYDGLLKGIVNPAVAIISAYKSRSCSFVQD
jgi:hypothetical protein